MNFPAIVKLRGPSVFSPKVTPDPEATERLEARLREAAQRLSQRCERSFARRMRRQLDVA